MGLVKIAVAVLLLQSLPAPAAPGSIAGLVSGAAGELLSRATVTLSPLPATTAGIATGRTATVSTSDDGKFAFDKLAPGSYLLSVSHAGYVPLEYGQNGPDGSFIPVKVASGEDRKDFRLVMIPDGTITGRVVDRNGEPLGRARVQALQYSYSLQGRGLSVVQSTTTDDMGAYRLFWLPPGIYFVSALPSPSPLLAAARSISNPIVTSRSLPDGSAVEEAWTPIYFPGASDVQSAAPVTVRAGETLSGIQIAAAPVRVQRVRGVTIDGTTGQPAAMSLTLYPKNRAPAAIGEIRSAGTGVFEISGVVPGSYFLKAVDGAIGAVLPLEVGKADVSNFRLTATLGFTIRGQIHIDGSAANRIPADVKPRLHLSGAIATSSFDDPLGSDGTFSLPGVFPGDYQVDILGIPNLYVKSITLGSRDVLIDGIHLQSQPDLPLDITLGSVTSTLEVVPVDAMRQSQSAAAVVMIPEPPLRRRSSLYFTPSVDDSDRLIIKAPPGRYKVFAWEAVEPHAWFDADFIRNYESRGYPVTVAEGSSDIIQVPVIPKVR